MRPLILTCVLIGVAAAMAPNYIRPLLPQKSDAGAAAGVGQAQEAGSIRANTVEVQASRDGHFYLDAEVNWRDIRFMVDTGATVVALRASDAASAGIRLNPAQYDKPVATANGTTYAAEVELDSVSVDEVSVPSVRALVLQDDQLQISLLGGSFLNRLKRFQVESGTLVLED